MYLNMLSSKSSSASQLTSVALSLALPSSNGLTSLLGGLARSKARSVWADAQKKAKTKSEEIVFERWTLDEAVEEISIAEAKPSQTPLSVLASIAVKQRVKQHLGRFFVDAVGVASEECVDKKRSASKQENGARDEEKELKRTIEASKEVGGDVAELGRKLERVWKASSSPFGLVASVALPSSEDCNLSALDAEINSLLTALVLYRRLFSGPTAASVSSALISPPPSPSTRSRTPTPTKDSMGNALLDLRKALGSRVFEDGEQEGDGESAMELARDKVVDLVVEMERRGRSVTPA